MAATNTTPTPPPPASPHLNTSFTLTRLTPLFFLTSSRLARYAHEFRDIVKGDILRGVRTTALSTDKAKTSLVRSCDWTFEDLGMSRETECLVVRLSWEDGSLFTAVLLPDFMSLNNTTLGKRKRGAGGAGGGTGGDREFTSLPLLLSRGSQVVREQFITYLSTRFDCRAAEVILPATLLQECLQGYLERCLSEEEDSQRVLDRRVKILEIMFTIPETKDVKVKGALRKITISLPSQDLHEMYRRYLSIPLPLHPYSMMVILVPFRMVLASRLLFLTLMVDHRL